MDYQVIIIGAGTAGLSAAQHCRYHGLTTLIIEQIAVGGQTLQIPEITNLAGVPERTSGIGFAELLEQTVKGLGAEFIYQRVESIMMIPPLSSVPNPSTFQVKTSEKTFSCSQVILATGTKPKVLDVPGAKELEGRGISYCAPCDGPLFRNKPVAVVGGGDGAYEEAMYLSHLASEVHLLIRTVPRARTYLQDQANTKPNIHYHFQTEITEIESALSDYGFPVVSAIQTNQGRLPVTGLFVMIGSIPEYPEIQLLNGFTLQLTNTDQNYLDTDTNCETSVQGLFCLGAARKQPIALIQIGLSDGAIAAQKAKTNLGL